MWSPCIIRSHVSGRGNITNAKAHTDYILRPEECIGWAMHSCAREIFTKEQARERWEEIGLIETGLLAKDFAQGRQRHDGAIQARYIIPLPNSIVEDFDEGMVKSICELVAGQVAGESMDYIWALHRGEKEKNEEQNLHLHVDVRPRTMEKKIRMVRKELRDHCRHLRRKIGVILQELGYEIEPVETAIKRGSSQHMGPALTAMAAKGTRAENPVIEEKIEKIQDVKRSKKELKASIEEIIHDGWGSGEMLKRLEKAGLRLFQEGRRKTWKVGCDRFSFSLRRILKVTEDEVNRAIQAEQMKELAKERVRKQRQERFQTQRRKITVPAELVLEYEEMEMMR